MKCSDVTNKWMAPECEFRKARERVHEALMEYSYYIFKYHADVTSRQAGDEFWLRIADHWGHKIDFNRDVRPDGLPQRID